jgi:tetratricopeptide (TPR) repeat protein
MSRVVFLIAFIALLQGAHASWYWPFGSSERERPRLSEIMEPASTNIDAAADFVADGNFTDAILRYERALAELDRIEREYEDSMHLPEFSTIKTKRAYVRAAVDSLKLKQVKDNARSVSVSDTADLEKKLAEERSSTKAPTPAVSSQKPVSPKVVSSPRVERSLKNLPPKQRVAAAIAKGDYEFADKEIAHMLKKIPNDIVALNLKAAMESAQGKYKDAEKTLDQAIFSHPKSYHAYFNMARIKLAANPPYKDGARRYYENGRIYGGPQNKATEAALMEGAQ